MKTIYLLVALGILSLGHCSRLKDKAHSLVLPLVKWAEKVTRVPGQDSATLAKKQEDRNVMGGKLKKEPLDDHP